MRITDLLDRRSIDINGSAASKEEALNKVIDLMCKSGKISDRKAYADKVFAREKEGTTGTGEGIAIPHGKCDAVKSPGLAAMVVRGGVDFDSLDGDPVTLIFLIAAPNTKDNVHLDVLSKLSVMLMDDTFAEKLRNAKSADDFLKIIDAADETASIDSYGSVAENAKCNIVAVTGCPTGIAHTYMAAEALEKAAKANGCSIKVETPGSGGAKNVLTAEEIAAADFVIIAADTQVPMGRFNGKKLIDCQVSDGISKADELIKRAIAGDGPVYHGSGAVDEASGAAGGSFWHRVYTQLMNGVSHMLPFVVGGGILTAIAFLIDGLAVDINSLDEAARSNFGSITTAAAIFKNIGGLAMGLMLPVLAGYISMSIADRPGLAPGFVGGLIAANGTSGFLGALVAGFAAGYAVVLLKKVFDKLPAALDGIKPVLLYPVFGVLITGLFMLYIVEPPVGALNTWMNESLNGLGNSSKVIVGIIVAGMMAVDMGGPVNKAAYVFGTASIAAGNYYIMAAVMIGGMVPPCAIALSTLIFKNKYTAEERKSGPTNFIMGLGFITEGAIPFAASDPLRVIPSCVIGSALAGALSAAFGCTLMAPHGGIFVFPVVDHPLLYLVALAAGTVATAVILGLVKRSKS